MQQKGKTSTTKTERMTGKGRKNQHHNNRRGIHNRPAKSVKTAAESASTGTGTTHQQNREIVLFIPPTL